MYKVTNCHDAIISHETYELVQTEQQRRASVKKTVIKDASTQSITYSKKYALSSIMVCSECNTLFQRCTWSISGKKRIVWRCRNRINYGTRYCKQSPTLDEPLLHQALIKAINGQLYRPEYLLAPFDGSLIESPSELAAQPAKSWPELYSNLLALQRQIDLKFAALIQQCVETKEWESCTNQFRQLMEQRNTYSTWIDSFEMHQYQTTHCQAHYNLPYCLTKYNDLIVRLVMDTVTVLDEKHLRIKFKSGLEVEQTI